MSISLNDHESRIKALEDKINSGALSGWSSGSGNGGYWIRENKTGLTFQWGVLYANGAWQTFNLPIPFNTDNFVIMAHPVYGRVDGNGGLYGLGHYSRQSFGSAGYNGWKFAYSAIGYLVSNRVLNSFISLLEEVF